MNKCLLFLFFGFKLSGILQAQQPLLKTSAERFSMIQKSNPDTNRINLYYSLGQFYLGNYSSASSQQSLYADSAIAAFTKGIYLADSLHTDHHWFQLKSLLGKALAFKGDTISAEKVFMEVIDGYRKKGYKDREALTWKFMAGSRERNEANFSYIHKCLYNAVELYRNLNQTENQAKTQLQIADLYLVLNRYQEAENLALPALNLYRSIHYGKLYDTYYLLSVINRYKGDLDRALFFALRCVQNVDSLQDKSVSPVLFYGELALVYDGLGQPEESSKWYRLTLEGRQKWPEDPVIIIRTAGLLVHQLVKLNKLQEALTVMLNMRKEYGSGSDLAQATIAQNLGFCYQALGNYSKAGNYFSEMDRKFGPAPYPDEFSSIAYQDIGNFYLATKRYAKALAFLSKALESSNDFLVTRQRDIFLSMYTADSAMGNYLAAINDFRKYKMLTDSLFNERKTHQIAELEIRYQTDKKEKDIIVLNLQNKAQEVKLLKSTRTRNLIIAAVLLFAGIFYYLYRIKSHSNKKMAEQQKLINQKNHTLTQLVKEKEWLVREIHHRVKNNFHTVIGLLATQSQFLKNPEAIEAMRESRNRIHAMAIIHQKLYQSDNLSTIDMPAYINELVNSLRGTFNLSGNIQFVLDIDAVELDLSHAIPLGLILNEAITNAIKYAFPEERAGVIEISLKRKEGERLLIMIRDNGIGLSTDNKTTQDSMGMKLLKGLSEDMDASLTVNGKDGTTILVEFLYAPDKSHI